MASKHKIRVNLKIGTKNTRIGVPRELEEWMKTTLYRDNTTLRWILFEDRVAPRHHRQLPDGVDRCVCMLQPTRTTVDGVSYLASCRTAMSRGQRRVFESHARQIEQDDRFVSGVLTAQSCENLLHYDVEPNASSDIMIVSDIDLPSKPSSKCIVTSHSLQPESSAQPSPTSDGILCTAHDLLETCCNMKAKLLILTITYPGAWEVLFHVELCNVLHTLAEHGIDFVYHTPCRVSSQYNLPRDFPHSECRGDLTVYSTSSRIVQRTLDWGRHRKWSFAPFTVLDVGNPSYWDALLPVFVEEMADRVACVAFPAEAAAEMRDERGSTLDDPGNDTMPVPLDEDLSKAVDREKDLLDAMPLPGTPVDEAERRRSWNALPLRVRTAIDSLGIHHQRFWYKSCVQLGLLPSTFRHADIFGVMPVKTSIYQSGASERLRFRSESRHRCSGSQRCCRRTLPVFEHSRLGYYFPTSSIAATGTRFAVQPRVLGQFCQSVVFTTAELLHVHLPNMES